MRALHILVAFSIFILVCKNACLVHYMNSLHSIVCIQVAHQAGAYPGFCSMKPLGVFLFILPPSIKFASMHSYTWVERGTVRVKCLAQEHITMSLAKA